MVVGETGVGKSFWLHNLLNYIQKIKLEENNRYYLFDEKNLEEQYEKQYGEKLPNHLIMEKPYLYNIKATNVYQNPIRILDTQGYGDTRGLTYDIAKFQEIKNLSVKLGINSFNAICLFFKAYTARIRFLKFIYEQLATLFGKDIINNIIVIFTFAEDYKEFDALKALKSKEGDFYECFGDMDNIPYFTFNNMAYFSDERAFVKKMFENNNTNFSRFFNTVSSFKRISLAKNN